MKKGLRQFYPTPTDIPAGAVFTGTAPTEGGTHFTTGMGLLGNGNWGDCYWAAASRLGHTFSKIGGRGRNFVEPQTLTTYARYLGLNSADELNARNDQGTDARAGAKYLVKYGVLDSNGKGDRIGAYAFESDAHKVPALVAALGGGIVCVELTSGCEDEFAAAERENRPFVWDTKLGTNIVGGHAIPVTYWTPQGLGVNSWDREGIITWDYLAKYMQTTVVYFSAAILGADGVAPDGLNKEKLIALVQEVTTS